MIFGVDIASWQGYPDMQLLRQEGHDFCISKLTGEDHYVNPYRNRNRDAARAAGFIWGDYDWCEPQTWRNDADGATGARQFLTAVGERWKGELLCIDFETPVWYTGPLGRNIESAMRAYVTTLKEEGGQDLLTYTGPYFLDETGARSWSWLAQMTKFWIAAPGEGMLPDTAPWPGGYPPFAQAVMHQHQWYATSPAIVGHYDRDRFLGTRADLMTLGYGGQPGQEGNVKEPAEGTAAQYINAKGETISVVNWGGNAAQIKGVAYNDLGAHVLGHDGAEYNRSLIHGSMQPWIKTGA